MIVRRAITKKPRIKNRMSLDYGVYPRRGFSEILLHVKTSHDFNEGVRDGLVVTENSLALDLSEELEGEQDTLIDIGDVNSSTTSGLPYNTLWWMSKVQYIIFASELLEKGWSIGALITSLTMKSAREPGQDIINLRIRLKETKDEALSSWHTDGFTLVYYNPKIFKEALAANEEFKHVFNEGEFFWQGGNLLIDITREDTSYSSSGGNYYFNTTVDNRFIYGYQDSGSYYPGDHLRVRGTHSWILWNEFKINPCLFLNKGSYTHPPLNLTKYGEQDFPIFLKWQANTPSGTYTSAQTAITMSEQYTDEEVGVYDGSSKEFDLPFMPETGEPLEIKVNGEAASNYKVEGSRVIFNPGTVVYDEPGEYYYQAFEGRTEEDILLVAGGGAGGNRRNSSGWGSQGGGGGGGVRRETIPVTPGELYTIKVGRGGEVYLGDDLPGENGENSSFGDIEALGGGGGGSREHRDGADGGAGGGSDLNGVGGSGEPGQGNDGGDSGDPGGTGENLAGGGGSGNTSSGGTGYAGGDGAEHDGRYFCGGGAGGSDGSTQAEGGLGGGGKGGSSGSDPEDGEPGTGGGGGGSRGNSSHHSGKGGSGRVEIFSEAANLNEGDVITATGVGLAYPKEEDWIYQNNNSVVIGIPVDKTGQNLWVRVNLHSSGSHTSLLNSIMLTSGRTIIHNIGYAEVTGVSSVQTQGFKNVYHSTEFTGVSSVQTVQTV